MKMISWNVNGIRAVLKKGFLDFMAENNPDVICLQETRTGVDVVAIDLPGYAQYWNAAQKKGYAGTAIFTKIQPLSSHFGIYTQHDDPEGRAITLEFDHYYLVNVYVPNSKRDLSRLDYRSAQWDVSLLAYLKMLEHKKPVICCGDLNVAHQEIDLTYPKANVGNHGFTAEERLGFNKLIEAGFIDTFREFQKEGGHYTWWSPFSNSRARNIGWRIDYFIVSQALRPQLKNSYILKDILGSDHCPIVLEMHDYA